MGITARGAWEAVKRHFREMDIDIGVTPFTVGRRRRHVGRRVRQRHVAREHDRLVGGLRPSRHLHRSRSRSGEELCRAQAHVRAAALELAGLRQDADLQGRRRCIRARRRKSASAPRRRSCSASAEAVTPQAADEGDPQGAKSTFCSSAASAPMCAPRAKATTRPATAPTTRSASLAPTCACKVVGEGANLGMTQRGRVEAALARRAAQHRRHRQFRRRQHLRRRGQYQGRAVAAGALPAA